MARYGNSQSPWACAPESALSCFLSALYLRKCSPIPRLPISSAHILDCSSLPNFMAPSRADPALDGLQTLQRLRTAHLCLVTSKCRRESAEHRRCENHGSAKYMCSVFGGRCVGRYALGAKQEENHHPLDSRARLRARVRTQDRAGMFAARCCLLVKAPTAKLCRDCTD